MRRGRALRGNGLPSRRDADAVLAINPAAARNVIDAAIAQGLDPIVHVSSVTALFTPGAGPVHPDLPVARLSQCVRAVEGLAEEHARRRQAEGASVVITYPAGVTGPPAGPVTGAVADSIGTILRTGAMPLADARSLTSTSATWPSCTTACSSPASGPDDSSAVATSSMVPASLASSAN